MKIVYPEKFKECKSFYRCIVNDNNNPLYIVNIKRINYSIKNVVIYERKIKTFSSLPFIYKEYNYEKDQFVSYFFPNLRDKIISSVLKDCYDTSCSINKVLIINSEEDFQKLLVKYNILNKWLLMKLKSLN